MNISENLKNIKTAIPDNVSLVAVSKTKPISDLQEAYDAGQRIFGENKVQELVEKETILPKDIKWHMIGHLQRNKVKYIAPFVDLIHAVDSLKLLQEINKQALKNNRIIDCLLQIKIANEDSKFGLSKTDVMALIQNPIFSSLNNIKIKGLMGMATFTESKTQITSEFQLLYTIFESLKTENHKNIDLQILSMGMSGDYQIAISCGSNMVRVGSHIFGKRNYN